MQQRIVLFDANTETINLPLGLLYATALIDPNRYDIRIITKRDYPNYKQTIQDLCKDAMYFGVSCFTGKHIATGLEMTNFVKQMYPSLPTIWGGWQPVTLPDMTLSHPSIDYVCTGQGERTLAEFTDMIASGDLNCVSTIQDLSYKQAGKAIHNAKRPFEDVNHFPDFNQKAVNLGNHIVSNRGDSLRMIHLQTSAGCPFRCGFCCEQYSCQRRWYGLSPERMITMLNNLRTQVQFDSVMPTDSNFFVKEARIAEFCRLLIQQDFNISIQMACGRANTLTQYSQDTWELMAKAGLKSILVGMESANEDTLRFINKDATVAQMDQLCAVADKWGVQLHMSTVMGFPLPQYLEQPQAAFDRELNELYEYYRKMHFSISKHHDFAIWYYAPYPNSPLFDKAIQAGYQAPRSLQEWAEYDIADVHVPWIKPSAAAKRKIRLLRYIFRLLGADYEAYISRLPAPIRWMGMALIRGTKWMADVRLRRNWFRMPLDFYLVTSLEKAFRKINARRRIIDISETFPRL